MTSFSNRIFSMVVAMTFISVPAYMETDEMFLQDESVDLASTVENVEKDEAVVKASNVLIADTDTDSDEEGEEHEEGDMAPDSDDADDVKPEEEAEPTSFDDSEHVFSLEDETDEF